MGLDKKSSTGIEYNMDYIQINTESDIQELNKKFNYFHDSCIKEINYISGEYVDAKGAMYPFNSERKLSVILQSQNAQIRAIELVFEKIKSFYLAPKIPDYDGIIYESFFKKGQNFFYWSDSDEFIAEPKLDETGTFIIAEAVKWRKVNFLGNEQVYKMKKI